jgi:hypothetical protein
MIRLEVDVALNCRPNKRERRCMEITATSMKRVCAEMDEHIAKANGDRSTVHASILVGYTFAGNEARTIADAIERGDQP